jgi:hypothetical protein
VYSLLCLSISEERHIVFVCLSITKVRILKCSYILNEISSRLCMLAYKHIRICNMSFSISALVSSRDSHISPRLKEYTYKIVCHTKLCIKVYKWKVIFNRKTTFFLWLRCVFFIMSLYFWGETYCFCLFINHES